MSQPGELISLRTDLKAAVWKRKDDGRSYQPSPEDPRSANEEKKYVRSQKKKKKKKHQSAFAEYSRRVIHQATWSGHNLGDFWC